MAVNKVEINGVVTLDLTADTVTAAKLAHGETAHDASGELITGTMAVPQLQIVVTTSAGATVTATKGSKTVSGTADASGNCTLVVDEAGEWLLTSTLGSNSRSATVAVGVVNADLQFLNLAANFADNDWATIALACQANAVPDTWAVGDTKPMPIGGTSYGVRIIGKNHDDYADGAGKAPLTLQVAHVLATTYSMNATSTNTTLWKNSQMRLTTLPEVLSTLPTDVQSAIRSVTKKCAADTTHNYTSEDVSDKLFLLSAMEATGGGSYAGQSGEGLQYQYYLDGGASSLVKRYGGAARVWWLRTPVFNNTSKFALIQTTGSGYSNSANTKNYISPAFCF